MLFNTAIRDRGMIARLLDNIATRLIARWSYTLYLVHRGLIVAMTGSLDARPSLATAAAVLLAVGYAMLMWRFVEKPLGAWRQRREREMAERELQPRYAPVA
ncbi:hypothetical protein [Sphingomonas sp. RS2018]